MFSIVAPLDPNRLEQFKQTKQVYDEMPEVKEFIIPTRNIGEVQTYLEAYDLMKDVTLVPYEHEVGFNPAKALNIGVRTAKYDSVIITSPEVKPSSTVLKQLSECIGRNIVCQVSDQDENGNLSILVSSTFRGEDPSMYFLAMFNKSDLKQINGWDEEFMKGYAYEDNDFGARWNRAGLPFEVRDDIQAVHQYHPRGETLPGGMVTNQQHFYDNTDKGVVYCENGLDKV